MRRTRYRRRGSGGVWLPVYGNSSAGNTQDLAMGRVGQFGVIGDGSISWDATPVTFDYTESAYQNQIGTQSQTLRDIVAGQEWRLRRIVGKCFVGSYFRIPEGNDPQDVPIDAVRAVEIACGYLVCKTDEEGDATTDFDEVNPLIQESAEDPWIWRRKWCIQVQGTNGNPPNTGTPLYDYYQVKSSLPTFNGQYGSVQDGPHIDQKTARAIHRQERLYFMCAARCFTMGATQSFDSGQPVIVWYNVDHRFFGRLGSSMGNRRNASR